MELVDAANGRRQLAVESWGKPDGTPVFLLHGTPGSRNGPQPRGIVLYRLGVRLISYDRPGYGRSTRHPGRTVADAASDVEAIASHLNIDRFSVVGRSGGGPHALACASLLRDRVDKAAVLVSLAPSDAKDLDWFGGMTNSNVEEYSNVDSDPGVLMASLRDRAIRHRNDPESLIKALLPELSPSDRRVVDDMAMRRLLTQTYAEALRHGGDGWIDDVLALRRSWNFALEDIVAHTLLWHGAEDMFSPPSHTQWLAARIPKTSVEVQRGAAHFGAVEVLPEVLSWMAAPAGAEHRFASAGAGLSH